MNSDTIMIKGYRINIKKYHKFHDKPLPEDIESFNVLDDEDIFIVRREYDSVDFNDYGFYYATGIIKISKGKIDDKKISNFLNATSNDIRDSMPYHSKYGFFIDYYDVDRTYYFLNKQTIT